MSRKFILASAMLLGAWGLAATAQAADAVIITSPASSMTERRGMVIAPQTTPVISIVPVEPAPYSVPPDTVVISNPATAAGYFMERVSDAQWALSTDNPALAQTHIAAAQTLAAGLKAITPPDQRIIKVNLGRSVYMPTAVSNPVIYQYRYLPNQTGYVEVTTVENTVLVPTGHNFADVEAMNIRLDFSTDAPERYLQAAGAAIGEGDYAEAEQRLTELMENIVDNREQYDTALDKASNNIALARYFIIENNYAAARYALAHADKALENMQRDIHYKDKKDSILSIRMEIDQVQESIARADTSAPPIADSTMKRWWNNLHRWQRG
ncbi:MAG: hypothetical protein WDO70_12125 [Alphaproteobacteria bacterium]